MQNQNGHKNKLQRRTLFLNCKTTGQSGQQKTDADQQFKKLLDTKYVFKEFGSISSDRLFKESSGSLM